MIKANKLEIYPYTIWLGTFLDENACLRKFDFFPDVDALVMGEAVETPKSLYLTEGIGVTFPVQDIKSKSKGVLILFNEVYLDVDYKELFDVVSHESGHAADIIWQAILGIGHKDDFDSNSKNEPYMYLLGTIAGIFGLYVMQLRKEENE